MSPTRSSRWLLCAAPLLVSLLLAAPTRAEAGPLLGRWVHIGGGAGIAGGRGGEPVHGVGKGTIGAGFWIPGIYLGLEASFMVTPAVTPSLDGVSMGGIHVPLGPVHLMGGFRFGGGVGWPEAGARGRLVAGWQLGLIVKVGKLPGLRLSTDFDLGVSKPSVRGAAPLPNGMDGYPSVVQTLAIAF